MMAIVSGKFLEGGEKNLPPLSPNLEASQLLTPLQLERITIDNPHYQEHLMHSILHQSLISPVPNHQHVLHRRTAKLGDNYFFLQKDIPVPQTYARTALKLSEVRPWDQIMDRPLHSQRVIGKEVHLPFPQEHPYTSHISRFAVFPDTKFHQPSQPPQQDIKKLTMTPIASREECKPKSQDELVQPNKTSVQTQTALSSFATCFKPLPAYYIHQKASEWGQRVEEHHLSAPGIPSLSTDVGRTFWDLPRSRQHKRANTYPAPRLLYSAQVPDTPPASPSVEHTHTSATSPRLATPPSHTAATPPITTTTNEALDSIHRLLTRTTTYAEQFPRHTPPANPSNQNILRLDYSLRSCGSQRPWTNESRGKYCRRIPLSPKLGVESERDDVSEAESAELGMSDGVVFSLLNDPKEDHKISMKEEEISQNVDEKHKTELEHHGHVVKEVSVGEQESDFQAKNENQNEEGETQSQHETLDRSRGKVVTVDSSTQTLEADFDSAPAAVAQSGLPLPHVRTPQLHTTTTTTSAQPQGYGLSRLPQLAEFDSRHQSKPRLADSVVGVGGSLAVSKGHQSSSKSTDLVSRQSYQQLPQSTVRSPLEQSHTQPNASQLVKYPLSKRPLSAYINSLPAYYALQKPSHVRSYSANADLNPPLPPSSSSTQARTGEVTRRLMGLYNGFNKTEVMKKFHEQYPEKAPDLRDYSIRDGKRHVIHGSHAYYFH